MAKIRGGRAEPVPRRHEAAGRMIASLAASDNGAVKERIVEVALQHFAQAGFEGTSIGRIAEQCGISTPLIHYHFSSKLLLWQAAARAGAAQYYEELDLDGTDLIDLDILSRFKVFIRRYINFAFKRPYVFSLIIAESDISSERFIWLRDNLLGDFYTVWVEHIAQLKQDGFIRSDIADYHITQIIVGACNHFLNSRYRVLPLYDQDPDDEGLPRRHADLVIEMITQGLIATKP